MNSNCGQCDLKKFHVFVSLRYTVFFVYLKLIKNFPFQGPGTSFKKPTTSQGGPSPAMRYERSILFQIRIPHILCCGIFISEG